MIEFPLRARRLLALYDSDPGALRRASERLGLGAERISGYGYQ
jgi:hypothetical protein